MSKQIDNLMKIPKKDTGVNVPHKDIRTANTVHQADLLFLPDDRGYKYALIVVDVASRQMDGEPLKNKYARTVKDAFVRIYSRNIINVPRRIEVDSGSEFGADVKKYFKNTETFIRVSKPGRHRQQAMVEKRNQLLSIILFKLQLEEELLTGEPSIEWVNDLPIAISVLNEKAKQYKKKSQHKYGDPVCGGDSCELLEEGTKVRVALDNPRDIPTGKQLGTRFRAVDIRWDIQPRVIKRVLITPDQPPLYLLNGVKGPEDIDYSASYTKNQLQVIPIDEIPPKLSSLRGQPPKKWRVENIINKRKSKNRVEYLVKWATGQLTWEPRKTLMQDVPKLVNQFEKNNN